MARKILKWIGIALGGLIGLLLLTTLVLFAIGTVKWSRIRGRNYDLLVERITIPADRASITRGEHIATIRMCQYCHGDDFGGQSDSVPGLFTFAFPNLTPGAGGVGAAYTDEDWVRAIRHGVGHDGRGLILMPSRLWYQLSDEDVGALIAYMKRLPPVDNELPATGLGPLGRVMLTLGKLPPDVTAPDVTLIDHDAPRPVAPEPGVRVEYGQYLADTCTLCHGLDFNGQTIRLDAEYLSPNLTPGGDMALWSEEDFVATLRTGMTPSGHPLNVGMPWKYFGEMTDDELRAVWMFLRSLPALEQGT